MKYLEVIENLISINDNVVKLRENPGVDGLGKLIDYLVQIQEKLAEYKLTHDNKEIVARALIKLINLEKTARNYYALHEGTISSYDLAVFFEAYQEAFDEFFE